MALGTVQFGLPYGVANRDGKVSLGQTTAILNRAKIAGLDTLDTAIAYGESETRLGKIKVDRWNVVTKLPPIPSDCVDVSGWAESMVTASMERLGIKMLYGLLLHQSSDLSGTRGETLYRAIDELKTNGFTKKLGLSVYTPQELGSVIQNFQIDLVQAPFNVLDRRLRSSGWLKRLKDKGVEVHARSVFLQGLLLMDEVDRPKKFQPWDKLWRRWHDWLNENRLMPLQAALGFVLAQREFDRIIVGVDNVSQLDQILEAARNPVLQPPDDLNAENEDVINPSRWYLL